MDNLSPEYYALCPLDGRYNGISKQLSPYFSEFALVKNRVKVEVLWLKFLIENAKNIDIINNFNRKNLQGILDIYEKFDESSFLRIKQIEAITNHDVKAVELFVAEKLEQLKLKELKSFVHFGCTSEDINNAAYANMISGALELWIKNAENLTNKLDEFAKNYADIPMLAHTHGQPASPTTIGKEFAVYRYRLLKSLENIKSVNPQVKFGGATGNFSAISVALPNQDWFELSKNFVENQLKFEFNPLTTQIENHDYICHLADGVKHFNNVLMDLDVDMWLYISKGYFRQVAVKHEVGSSTMPHKVNPIRFENSEANITMSNAIFAALSDKLPKSRMQRDLSDSSAKRNIGLGFGYSLQAILQTIGGLEKVAVNESKITDELESKWEVLAEPIQTVLRKYGLPDAYDKLKDLTRGKEITKEIMHEFINSLNMISEDDKQNLLSLTPNSYVGIASKLANLDLNKFINKKSKGKNNE